MTDPIETRLYEYFGKLRPNPPLPAEARMLAALDRAAVKPATAPFFSRSPRPVLRGGAQRFVLLATAAVAIAAVLGTYGLSTAGPGPGATSSSPSTSASATQSATPSASPSAAAIVRPSPTEPPGPSSTKPAAGRMTEWRDGAVAALLQDGRVLIVGGNGGGGSDLDMASAELFDPATNAFSATGSMYQKHGRQATATVLLDGRVLVVGGADQEGMQISSDAELYDPATGKFSETGQTAEPTWYHTATRLPDGRVLIITSDDLSQGAHSQIYDPARGEFTRGASMTAVSMPEVTALLANGRVLVVGEQANAGGAGPAVAELYDPASGTFSPTGGPVSAPTEVKGTMLADGRVCIASSGLIQIYDPATGKFTRAASLTYAPRPHNVFALPDGRVLVTYYNQTNPSSRLLSATIFNPATGKTALSGKMVVYRAEFTDTLLLDGRVFVAGGALIYLDRNVGELFDPKTNTFKATGP